jgi:hypothetical protein
MTRCFASCVLLLAAWMVIASAAASAFGQGRTVQLPTYSFFNASTTVDVPDGGSTYMGGISRSAEGRNEFGVPGMPFRPFKNVGIGQQRSASGMRVTATIHDLAGMDEAILNGTPTSMAAAGHTIQPRGADLAGHWDIPPAAALPPAGPTLADLATQRDSRRAARTSESQTFFERARQAESDGKPNVARIYYQMVARRAGGDLKQQALARLDALGASRSPARVAQSQP